MSQSFVLRCMFSQMTKSPILSCQYKWVGRNKIHSFHWLLSCTNECLIILLEGTTYVEAIFETHKTYYTKNFRLVLYCSIGNISLFVFDNILKSFWQSLIGDAILGSHGHCFVLVRLCALCVCMCVSKEYKSICHAINENSINKFLVRDAVCHHISSNRRPHFSGRRFREPILCSFALWFNIYAACYFWWEQICTLYIYALPVSQPIAKLELSPNIRCAQHFFVNSILLLPFLVCCGLWLSILLINEMGFRSKFDFKLILLALRKSFRFFVFGAPHEN